MDFDEIIQLQVLKLKASHHGSSLGGLLLEDAIERGQVPELRQMCAKVHPELHDRLEHVTSLLGMSKREFIEGAVADALIRAQEMIERAGVLDHREL
jgi:L-amino acid N-acyltransferase YncA